MWSLFPELLGPIIVAFLVGSLTAWALVGLLLPRLPEAEEPPAGSGGP